MSVRKFREWLKDVVDKLRKGECGRVPQPA